MPPYQQYPYQQYSNVWRPPPPPPTYGRGQPASYWAPPAPSGWNPGAYTQQPQQQPQQPEPKPKEFRSEKYPQLNPVLAADSTLVRFNATKKPSQEILTSTYYNYRHAPANMVRVKLMRLVSKHFPWAVDIPAPATEQGIACDMVWTAVWECLQQPIVDSEWALILQDKKKMEKMVKAHKKRTGSDNIKGDMKFRRCDYLGEEVWFRGLEKDEAFLKARLLPGEKAVPDTWMVVLGDK